MTSDEAVHTFLKGINPKANVIVQLELELAYYNILVQRIDHYGDYLLLFWRGGGL